MGPIRRFTNYSCVFMMHHVTGGTDNRFITDLWDEGDGQYNNISIIKCQSNTFHSAFSVLLRQMQKTII